jgi:hypothetical protein
MEKFIVVMENIFQNEKMKAKTKTNKPNKLSKQPNQSVLRYYRQNPLDLQILCGTNI